MEQRHRLKIGDQTQYGKIMFIHRPNGKYHANIITPTGKEVCLPILKLRKIKS